MGGEKGSFHQYRGHSKLSQRKVLSKKVIITKYRNNDYKKVTEGIRGIAACADKAP